MDQVHWGSPWTRGQQKGTNLFELSVLQKDTAQWPQPLNLTIHYQLHICTVLKPIGYPMYRNLKKHLREISGALGDKTVLKVIVHQIHLKMYVVRFMGIIILKKIEGQKVNYNW